MTPFLSIASYALLPALALTLSSVWASYYPLSRKTKSAILHFSAGVIFSVIAVEILPQVVEYHDWLLTTLGFGSAIGLMLLIRQVTENTHQPAQSQPTASIPITFLVLLGIDVIVDAVASDLHNSHG
ncbi:ZIP family metal transporter [Spirosoma flavum]|uniref:Transporter n=1 Tax=Spirosoma flavum TaxID=2048557 RepID=A0ABW6AG77_9BACT